MQQVPSGISKHFQLPNKTKDFEQAIDDPVIFKDKLLDMLKKAKSEWIKQTLSLLKTKLAKFQLYDEFLTNGGLARQLLKTESIPIPNREEIQENIGTFCTV